MVSSPIITIATLTVISALTVLFLIIRALLRLILAIRLPEPITDLVVAVIILIISRSAIIIVVPAIIAIPALAIVSTLTVVIVGALVVVRVVPAFTVVITGIVGFLCIDMIRGVSLFTTSSVLYFFIALGHTFTA